MADDSLSPEVEFRDIEGFPGYQIGNDGTVRSNLYAKNRAKLLPGQWRYLTLTPNTLGYHLVRLSKDKKSHPIYVHRLVLEAFVGPCPPGMICCHTDGNPANNHLSNLRWDTSKSNQNDRVLHGTSNRGSRCYSAKLKEEDIDDIRRLYISGMYQREIAQIYGVHQVTISCILRGTTWKNVD